MAHQDQWKLSIWLPHPKAAAEYAGNIQIFDFAHQGMYHVLQIWPEEVTG
jgi:hypothetical protein